MKFREIQTAKGWTTGRAIGAAASAAILAALAGSAVEAQTSDLGRKSGTATARLIESQLAARGSARVIIMHDAPAGRADSADASRALLARATDTLLSGVPASDARRAEWSVNAASLMPVFAVTMNRAELNAVARSKNVVRIWPDQRNRFALDGSMPSIGLPNPLPPAVAGADGKGATIAVLDSGVEAGHPFFNGRVVAEACFSANVKGESASLCPNKANTQTGAGSSAPCKAPFEGCEHGTHVAGIAAGKRSGNTGPAGGVAPGANILAVNIFSTNCDAGQSCREISSWDSDGIAALNWVLEQHARIPGGVAAVNMSIGAGEFAGACDDRPYKVAIDALRAAGIAVVVASGNSRFKNAAGSPGCVSSAVTVGSITKAGRISEFSNMSPIVDLMAPGTAIMSSVLNGRFESMDGTSMATPHVTGAFAVLKARFPRASVAELEEALRATGPAIRDDRPGGTHSRPGIKVDLAIAHLAKTHTGVAATPPPATSTTPPPPVAKGPTPPNPCDTTSAASSALTGGSADKAGCK
ncbi:MAG TPA: S8 family serine peptidase [Hyphomicrobiaceae bacterium]|nr:S8 family serine peptidase [Hyphomicrobiaceae bacterium]